MESDSTIGNVYLPLNTKTILKLLVENANQSKTKELSVIANNVEAPILGVNWVFRNSSASKEWLLYLDINFSLTEIFHFLNEPFQESAVNQLPRSNYLLFH